MTVDRVVVVGAGIIGLAIARQILHTRPGGEVVVVDKEHRLAAHQSGRNSGVVHAGVYYPPGSLKARLCRRGVGMLRELCAEHGVTYRECGKIVVASDRDELGRLDELERRATANGVPGLSRLGPAGIAEFEPHVTGVDALHSPSTAVTDFAAVCHALATEVGAAGGQILLGHEVVALTPYAGRVRVRVRRDTRMDEVGGSRVDGDVGHLADGTTFDAGTVIVCAGLHADWLARLAGGARDPRIVPFRGEYLGLVPSARHLVNALVYPVPDPRYPFLGVHLSRTYDDQVVIGPNAVLALAREGYRWRDVDLRELAATLAYPGMLRLAARHWRTGVGELYRSVVRRAFLRRARVYVPELAAEHLEDRPAWKAGVRAQALARDGSLVDDFLIERHGPLTVLRNVPSPAATSSLAIAEHVVARWDERPAMR